jgi:hypothetical protein
MVRLKTATQSINQRHHAVMRLAAQHNNLADLVPLRTDRAVFATIAVPPAGVGFFSSRCTVLSAKAMPTALIDDHGPSLPLPTCHVPGKGDQASTLSPRQQDVHGDPIGAAGDAAGGSAASKRSDSVIVLR